MKSVKEFNKYDAYLFLLTFSLIFGNLGGALMVVRVLAILFFFSFIKNTRSCNGFIGKYYKCFVFFYIFCLVSILWTSNREEGVKELMYFLVHFILFLEILVFSRLANNSLKSISMGWLIGVGITLCIAIWEITTGSHLSISLIDAEEQVLNVSGVILDKPFASVTFGNFNGYVVYLCFAMPFLYYVILNFSQQKRMAILAVVILLISIIVILINASRGGLITIGVMGMLFFLMTKRSKNKVLLLVVLAILFICFILPRADALFLAISVRSEGGALLEDQGRVEIWKTSLNVLRNSLYVGSGIGSISTSIKALNPNIIPQCHNMFLEILVQYGVVFFLVFLKYLYDLLISGKKSNDKNVKIMIYMALLALPIYSIIDSGYLLNPIVFVAFACFTVFAKNICYNESLVN